jgi:hypothetical protein
MQSYNKNIMKHIITKNPYNYLSYRDILIKHITIVENIIKKGSYF